MTRKRNRKLPHDVILFLAVIAVFVTFPGFASGEVSTDSHRAPAVTFAQAGVPGENSSGDALKSSPSPSPEPSPTASPSVLSTPSAEPSPTVSPAEPAPSAEPTPAPETPEPGVTEEPVSPEEPAEYSEEPEKKFRYSVNGHASMLWTFINDNKLTGAQYTLNSNRLRFDGKAFYGSRLSGRVIYDLEAYTGNLVSTPFWSQIQNPQANSYWNLSSGFSPASSVFLRHSIYRAYATYDAGPVQFTAGKQRVAWGVMRFWRPTDILNTESPLQLEPGEILGLDALYTKVNFSKTASLEGVIAPARFPGQQITAARANITSGTYDFTLIGGKVRGNTVAGFTFDGYIGEGGFRGEIIRIRPLPQFGKPYYQWTIGGDYSFPGNLAVTLEYLNNGGATGVPVDPFFGYTPGFLTTQNRQFVGLNVTKQISPLWRLDTFASYDIDGRSIAFAPRLYWDYKQNVDISFGTMLFKGRAGGEYTNYPNLLFTQIKYYF